MDFRNFFEGKIICDLSNREFNLILGYFYDLICSCLWLSNEDVSVSKKLFSHQAEQQFPEQYNLDKIDFDEMFYGELKEFFVVFYKKLLSLWKDVQQERISVDDKDIISLSDYVKKLKSLKTDIDGLMANK